MGQGVLIHEVSRSHSNTPHSVGLVWTSDQLVAGTSTWQHTTLTRDRYPYPRRVSNPQSTQASGRRPTSYNARPLGPAIWCYYRGNCFIHTSLFQLIAQLVLLFLQVSAANRSHLQGTSNVEDTYSLLYMFSDISGTIFIAISFIQWIYSIIKIVLNYNTSEI